MMACHVFRGVALGIIEDPMLTSTNISAAFRSTRSATLDGIAIDEPIPDNDILLGDLAPYRNFDTADAMAQ